MRNIVLILLLLPVCHSLAQIRDSAALQAASYFREADSASRDQRLWKQQLYGPILIVDPQSRLTYANRQDSAALLKQVMPGVYKGVLPPEVMVVNTAIRW